MSRHSRTKLLSEHARASLMAEAHVVASIRIREAVLVKLRETALGMKKANHRVGRTAAADSEYSSGDDDGGDDDDGDIDLRDVGSLISHLLALRRATCQFLLALSSWRTCKCAEEHARRQQEAEEEGWVDSLRVEEGFQSKAKGHSAEFTSTFASGGAPGGYPRVGAR